MKLRYGPISIGAYETRWVSDDIEAPKLDGFVTDMYARVVDRNGKSIPLKRVMLHHIVFKNAGTQDAPRFDGKCDRLTVPGSPRRRSRLAERFYGTGEENQRLKFPAGYGYQVKKNERWQMSAMLMNHRDTGDEAYVEYEVKVDDARTMTPVKPYWLDVVKCIADPIFNVPGGDSPGSTMTKTATWSPPEDGRIVSAVGHVHGGSKKLSLSQPRCGGRELARSDALWGLPDNLVYHVLPVLHEPGPISTSYSESQTGVPIKKGEPLTFSSTYDSEQLHARVMGIMHLYVAPKTAQSASEADTCAQLPIDLQNTQTPFQNAPGRLEPPPFTVPLTGLSATGKAREISRPPGKTRVLNGDVRINLKNSVFSTTNLSIPLGSTVRWQFRDAANHDVTVANGPRGFASPYLGRGSSYKKRFTEPGTYKLFCTIHPVTMAQTVTVRK